MVDREAEKKNDVHLEMRNLKANRASVTEEQRRERLRIRREKDRAKRTTKTTRGRRKGRRNRRQRESAPGHSQKNRARCTLYNHSLNREGGENKTTDQSIYPRL